MKAGTSTRSGTSASFSPAGTRARSLTACRSSSRTWRAMKDFSGASPRSSACPVSSLPSRYGATPCV